MPPLTGTLWTNPTTHLCAQLLNHLLRNKGNISASRAAIKESKPFLQHATISANACVTITKVRAAPGVILAIPAPPLDATSCAEQGELHSPSAARNPEETPASRP